MIRGRTLHVLGELASAPPHELRTARRAAHRSVDPLLRPLVRRRVTRLLATALFETGHADDDAHVHRLAYLRAAGRPAPDPDDREAVAAAFVEDRRRRRPPRALGWGGRATLAAIGATVAATALGYARFAPRAYGALEDLAPAVERAYERGGRPAEGSEALRVLMGEGVPGFALELRSLREAARSGDAGATADARDRLERRALALDAEAREALDPDAASFLAGVLREAIAISLAAPHEGTGEDSFIRSIDAFDAEMAARNLAYYLDGEVLREADGGRSVLLFTFETERVALYESAGRRVRALRLRRLDRINVQRAVLGFTRTNIRDALVLVGPLRRWVVGTVAPLLANRDPSDMVDDATRLRGAPWVAPVLARARRDVHEAMGSLAVDPVTLHAVALDLVRRRELLDGWARGLQPRGLRLTPPRGYRMDLRRYAGLRRHVPPAEWAELEDIVGRLGERDRVEAFRAMEARLADSVEGHEVQHRLDIERGEAIQLPPDLERRVGPLAYFGRDNGLARRALAELSAYLSEVARGQDIAKLQLAFLSRHLFDRRRWGSPESYAALLVFEGLGARFDLIEEGEDLVVGRSIDRARLAEIYLGLTDQPPRAIQEAALDLWAELMGRPLDPLRRIGPTRPSP